MALTPEQQAEYTKRQRNYKRTLCDAPTWKGLRPHAEAHKMSRAKFSGAVLKYFVKYPHSIDLDSMPEKSWSHSQAKWQKNGEGEWENVAPTPERAQDYAMREAIEQIKKQQRLGSEPYKLLNVENASYKKWDLKE